MWLICCPSSSNILSRSFRIQPNSPSPIFGSFAYSCPLSDILLCFFAPTSNPLQLPSYSSFHFGDKGFIHKPIKITLLHDIFVSQQISHEPLDRGRFSMVKVECLYVFVGFKCIPLLTSSICEIKSCMTQWKVHAVALPDYNTFFLTFVCTHADAHKILASSVNCVGGACPCALTKPAFTFLPVLMRMQ